jgi:hypothetical protein
VEQEFHPALPEDLLGIQGQAFGHLPFEDPALGVNQDHPDTRRVDSVVFFCRVAHEFVQLCTDFQPREPAAPDHERQQLPAHLRVGFIGGLGQHMDQVIAQAQGVGQILERQGVVVQTGDLAEVRHISQGDDQVVVREDRGPVSEAG